MSNSIHQNYILHHSQIAKPVESSADSQIRRLDADFGGHFGYSRLGIHHVVLPPHSRTSPPHAESHEEEFVFVVSGRPHVWIDGFVYELYENCAAGFPAGTGLAHSFINNTEKPIELLVFGERTKSENRCSFPLNPERKETCGIWWENPPARSLGPHLGRPGPIRSGDSSSEWPSCLVDCSKLERHQEWYYPGDSEMFVEYVRPTDALKLQVLGIGIETLKPGRRTSFPHSHKVEEEFLFVLSGRPTVWLNGYTYDVKAGEGIAFLPGTNIAHCLINNSDEPVHYVILGESHVEREKINYPMHPFRNQQMQKIGKFWEDRPHCTMGPHPGRPDLPIPEHLAFRTATENDIETILKIYSGCLSYFERTEGKAPDLNLVRHDLTDRPQKLTPNYSKEFLIVDSNDAPIGILDLHIHHPEEGMAYIGLLLIGDEISGKGWGSRIYRLCEDYLKRHHKIKSIRLGVSEANDVSPFWKKMGFEPNGKIYEWQGQQKITKVREFEKQI